MFITRIVIVFLIYFLITNYQMLQDILLFSIKIWSCSHIFRRYTIRNRSGNIVAQVMAKGITAHSAFYAILTKKCDRQHSRNDICLFCTSIDLPGFWHNNTYIPFLFAFLSHSRLLFILRDCQGRNVVSRTTLDVVSVRWFGLFLLKTKKGQW